MVTSSVVHLYDPKMLISFVALELRWIFWQIPESKSIEKIDHRSEFKLDTSKNFDYISKDNLFMRWVPLVVVDLVVEVLISWSLSLQKSSSQMHSSTTTFPPFQFCSKQPNGSVLVRWIQFLLQMTFELSLSTKIQNSCH